MSGRRITRSGYPHGMIPEPLYHEIERSMPILCVDFLLRRERGGIDEVGLIRRSSPYGDVWCHLGGRVRRGETLRAALLRHFDESVVGAGLLVPADPQPLYTFQWFPDDVRPEGFEFGRDERKHSVGLSFVLEVRGEPAARPNSEALDLQFSRADELPGPLWPGCTALFTQLLRG